MRSPLKIISFAIILTIINSTRAIAESQPPAELDRLKYFEGTWLSPWGRFLRLKAEIRELIYRELKDRRELLASGRSKMFG